MKEITESDKAKLAELNEAVTAAIRERTEWLDAKMSEYADIPIGDGIYDLASGVQVGVVTEHYRYSAGRDDGIWDTSLWVDHRFRTSRGSYDNTSRQPCKLGPKKRAEFRLRMKLSKMS